MSFKDYYEILGINTNKVNKEDIKLAYRNQAKKYHPDIIKSDDEKIKDINEAYKILSDTQKKKKYDRLWINYIGKNKKENKSFDYMEKDKTFNEELSNIFFGNILFSKKQNEKKENLDIYINLKITPEEAYEGTEKNISHNSKLIPIKIPAKSMNNSQIRIKHFGKKDKNNIQMPGDLIITLDIQKDDYYNVKGANIFKKIYISPAEAILGTKINEKVFSDEYLIIIPERVSNFKKIILKDRGMKRENNTKGDLVFEIIIKIPDEITEQEKELYEKILKLEKENKENKN